METLTERYAKLKQTDKEACELLSRGDVIPHTKAFELFKVLKDGQYFATARRLMERIEQTASPEFRLEIGQKRSLSTYKDTTLPAPDRFDDALKILDCCDSLKGTNNQETLGQAGAIHKLKWQWDGRKQHLEQACVYYRRGAQQNIYKDSGYTAINAAFVLDLLAHEEKILAENAGGEESSGRLFKEEAKQLRRYIVKSLRKPDYEKIEKVEFEKNSRTWWFKATLAEACFGRGKYVAARLYLNMRHDLEVPEWELESTARQLVALYSILPDESEDEKRRKRAALAVLAEFLPSSSLIAPLASGKVGLALSGGGFRAALFHIGVLARLAELDVLRHVEVISCVSGGSIVGTCYTLALRQLLERKPDQDIGRCDYIQLVNDLVVKFPQGVQKNLRLRLFTNVVKATKRIVSGWSLNYTNTHRMGELYEEHLFSAFATQDTTSSMTMQTLCINPVNRENQRPSSYNWQRLNKVPTLIVNATTLNTGHNWQFTPTWMGEPPKGVDADICVNERLRRMYYEEAPKEYQSFALGKAVAASSCVPGIFPPLPLKRLYPERTVKLVDGGVYDNQGVAGLLEQGCSVFLVSDASGQMQTSRKPSDNIVTILTRSNDIQATRLRVTQYREIAVKTSATHKNGLCFLHLMQGLDEPQVDWVDCQDPSQHVAEYPATTYGVYMKAQRALARMRTDLDSFSNIECCALMTSGYYLADKLWSEKLQELFPVEQTSNAVNWSFLAVGEEIARIPTDTRIQRWLEVGSKKFFKVVQCQFAKLPKSSSNWLFCAVILALTCFLTWQTKIIFDRYGLFKTIIGWIFMIGYWWFWLLPAPVIFAALLAVIVKLYLLTFDKLFLWMGRK